MYQELHAYSPEQAASPTPSSSDEQTLDFASERGEALVAETIVRSRKSWKTVKGRSEPVWPPHLEKVLVHALLMYKPHDPRYARALGRFPKRNRFISDFIYEQTGVRRSPKQVGSRLQQLKDVACGKKLLAQVASWSLSSVTGPGVNGADLQLNSNSPVDFSEGGDVIRVETGAIRNSRIYSPSNTTQDSNAYSHTKRITVAVALYPSSSEASSTTNQIPPFQIDAERPMAVFGGNLSKPLTLPHSRSSVFSEFGTPNQPTATFSSQEPVVAHSIARLWGPSSTSQPAHDFIGSSRSMPSLRKPTVKLETVRPLLCTRTPIIGAATGCTSLNLNAFDLAAQYSIIPSTAFVPSQALKGEQSASNRDKPDNMSENNEGNFVYAARLMSDEVWQTLLNDSENLSDYYITQDLVYDMDMGSTSKRGQVFLSVTYRFLTSHGHSSLAPKYPDFGSGFRYTHTLNQPVPSPTMSSPLTPISDSGSISPLPACESPVLPFPVRLDNVATALSHQYSVPPAYSMDGMSSGVDLSRMNQHSVTSSDMAISTMDGSIASFNSVSSGPLSHSNYLSTNAYTELPSNPFNSYSGMQRPQQAGGFTFTMN